MKRPTIGYNAECKMFECKDCGLVNPEHTFVLFHDNEECKFFQGKKDKTAPVIENTKKDFNSKEDVKRYALKLGDTDADAVVTFLDGDESPTEATPEEARAGVANGASLGNMAFYFLVAMDYDLEAALGVLYHEEHRERTADRSALMQLLPEIIKAGGLL